MNRRNFLSSIGAVVGACSLPLLPEGMAAKKLGGKYVVLFDPRRLSNMGAVAAAQSLGLPPETRIISVIPVDGEKLEDAISIVEVEK